MTDPTTRADLERQELDEQLDELMASPEASPLELAIVAGMLERLAPEDPRLDAARERASALDPGLLHQALAGALEDLEDLELDAAPGVSWEALCTLDEHLAAAAFVGRAELSTPFVQQALDCLYAFPEPWRAHATLAQAVLGERTPVRSDPAAHLWAAVEASPRLLVEDEGSGELSPELRIKAGLDVVISLFGEVGPQTHATLAATQRLAADGASLPASGPWLVLARGDTWQLALTTDLEDRPAVLLVGWAGSPPALQCDGQPVGWDQDNPEGLEAKARSGSWQLTLDGRTLAFTVQ